MRRRRLDGAVAAPSPPQPALAAIQQEARRAGRALRGPCATLQSDPVIRYEGTLYRPPSEANSLILQATIGCSYNECTFCGMYREKRFRVRPLAERALQIDPRFDVEMPAPEFPSGFGIDLENWLRTGRHRLSRRSEAHCS